MSVVGGYFYDVVSGSKLFASLIKHNSILIKVLSLSNHRYMLACVICRIPSIELACASSSVRMDI